FFMSYIQLISSPITLNRNTTQNVDISARDSSQPLKITVSANASASINGTCANNYSGIVFPANTYTISASKTQETFSHTLNYKCATIVATLQCNIVGNNLQLSFSCTPSGNDFITYSYPTSITISSIGYDAVETESWHTIYETPFSLSGGTLDISTSILGLVASRATRIYVSSGEYSATVYQPGGLVWGVPPNCDGCYCYCADDVVIDDNGTECYYESEEGYYETERVNISSGYHYSYGNNYITLTSDSDITNGIISISNECLTFKGYFDDGTNQSKYIYITKVEQYY
ncbi:MAG: hypothetical protein IKA90_00770, partial [Clostridia bacterium]|nr:hypothetical protein [Clostridia bacterium]